MSSSDENLIENNNSRNMVENIFNLVVSTKPAVEKEL